MRHNDNFQNKELFLKYYNNSISISEILIKMGLRAAGSNHKQVRKYCEIHNLPIPICDTKYKTKAANDKKRIDIELILVKNSNYNRGHLKKRLISMGILKNECSVCTLTEWRGMPIILQLEHKDGVHNNNELDNLCLLCPNCHSQTKTYCGRNKR